MYATRAMTTTDFYKTRTFISSAYVGAALVLVVLLSRIAVMEDANTPFTFDVMYVAVVIITCLQIVFYVGFPALKLSDRAGIETAGVLEKTRYAVARMGSANAYTRPQMKAGKADLKEPWSLIAHAKAIDKAASRQCQIVVARLGKCAGKRIRKPLL